MTSLARTVVEFRHRWPRFKDWLERNGAAALAPTNEFEVARFTTPEGIGIVYRNRRGELTSWQNGAGEAWLAWRGARPWRAVPREIRASSGKGQRRRIIQSIAHRDGWECAFCAEELSTATATVEHWVPITAGGPDHLSNKMLACEACNRAAGHLDVRAKLEMAIQRRLPTSIPSSPTPADQRIAP